MPALVWSIAAALLLVSLGDLSAQVRAAIPLLLIWGVGVVLLPRPQGGAARVLLAALALRAVLLASPVSLSDDLYRYLWEGRAVLLGGNPYLHPPGWEGWPADAIRAQVGHPAIPTIYPPLVMWLFAGVAAVLYDPLGAKIVFGLADALLAWALARTLEGRGRSTAPAWLYALHPLGAVESAGSGHLDALALLFLVLAIRGWDRAQAGRGGDGGVLAAVAGLGVKLFPALILPALLRVPGRRARRVGVALGGLGALLALSAPFWDAGETMFFAFQNYSRRWSFNGSIFPILETFSWSAFNDDLPARRFAVVLGALVTGFALLRRRDPAEVALWAGGAFVLLSPTVHPWYIAWAWVPALLCGVRAWTVLATLAPIAYAVLATLDLETDTWSEPTWTRPLIYVPFFLALAVEWGWRAMTAGPASAAGGERGGRRLDRRSRGVQGR